ncbi:MAG: putative ABC transporter permease subunit [Roseiflexaceae bacterium]
MLHAIGVLVRARLLIARNSFWRGKLRRKIGLLALLALLAFGAYGLYWLMGAAVRFFTSPFFLRTLADAARRDPTLDLPTQITRADIQPYLDALPSQALFLALVVLVLTSFTTVLTSLYLSGDTDMLLAAPVPMRAVFVVKFFGGLMVPYILLFGLLGPALFGYGQGLGYGPAFYVAAVLVLALLPLLPAGLGALLVMAVVRVVPARRAREIVSVIGGLFGASWYILNQLAPDVAPRLANVRTLESLRRLDLPVLPSAWAGHALIAAGRGEWLTLLAYGGLFATLSLAVFASCLLLAERLYYDGWSNMATQGGRVRTKNREQRTKSTSPSVLSSLFFVLPAQSRAILYKDLRVFPRDLRNLQQLIFPLALAGIWTFRLLTGGVPSGRGSAAEFAQFIDTAGSAGISFFICLTLSNALGGPSISREGRGFWLLRVAPISAWRLLIGKLSLAYLPFPSVGTLFVVFLSILRGGSPAELLRSLALVWVVGLGASSISLGLGAAYPRLDWENPARQTSFRAGCVAPVLYLLYIALALAATFGPPALARLIAPGWMLALAAAGWLLLVALTALVVWGALAFGAARLERIELG